MLVLLLCPVTMVSSLILGLFFFGRFLRIFWIDSHLI